MTCSVSLQKLILYFIKCIDINSYSAAGQHISLLKLELFIWECYIHTWRSQWETHTLDLCERGQLRNSCLDKTITDHRDGETHD